MVKVAGIRFKEAGKVYYFAPGSLDIEKNTDVIVETSRGIEFGKVVVGIKEVKEEDIISPLKEIKRIATEKDIEKNKKNKEKEKEAYDICLEKIEKHKLDMNLIEVEYTFDQNKILFYFTAEGRVDFRDLVKDLASIFKTRIELRQIGVRDETKMLGGIGVCGRILCCNSYLPNFQPVSIKMAKEQGLSLNPTKISGACGRLMCCLKYEQEAYEDLVKKTPNVGAIVRTPEGKGEVIRNSLLKGTVKVKLLKDEEADLKTYKIDEVKVLKNTKSKKNMVGESEEKIDMKELKQLED